MLCELPNVASENVAQAGEAAVRLEVGSGVAERAWNVLNVYRVATGGRLIAEGAERLQVPLQRHEVEAPAEVSSIAGPLQANKVLDEIVALRVGDVDVRISEQRRQVV